MLKILVGLVIAGLVAYIVYQQVGSVPLDARQTIDAGVEQVKQTAKLDSSQETLLRLQLSISDYMASQGSPPDELEVLVPKYFDRVPHDVATGKAYEYVRDGNSFRLGAQVSAPPVQVASAADGESQEEDILEIGVEGFVNPNTLVIDKFIYDPEGRRNPFEPFDFSNKVTVDSSLPPLQRYALGQLKVTAILSDARGDVTAFVEDARGIGYPVRVGVKIGNLGGVVESIEKDRVHVVETSVDFTGKEVKHHSVMKLQAAKKPD